MKFWGSPGPGYIAFVVACISVVALSAIAQEQPVDQRIAAPLVAAQQAELALRDAVIKAQRDDAQKREKDLSDWFRGYYAAPDKEAK